MAETTETDETDDTPAKAPAKKAVAKKAAAKKATPAAKAAEKAPAKKAAAKKVAAPVDTEPKPRAARKVREGIVASTTMDKTAVVVVTTRKPHPLYRKTMVRTSRLYTHDEDNTLRNGDRVRVAETRPLSKLKRWRLVEILERAK
jgi:small subunit ribosomal protein S17